jgi:hypothetical protein
MVTERSETYRIGNDLYEIEPGDRVLITEVFSAHPRFAMISSHVEDLYEGEWKVVQIRKVEDPAPEEAAPMPVIDMDNWSFANEE